MEKEKKEEKEEKKKKKVSLFTHTTARDMGKKDKSR